MFKLQKHTLAEDYNGDQVDLHDRVILVTGATGTIGSALCKRLAAQGATLILASRKVPNLQRLYDQIERAGGSQPAIYPVNLTGASPADFEQLAQTVQSELGRLDALIHLAAEFDALAPLAATSPEAWMANIHTNLNAPLFLTQAMLDLLRDGDGGQVIFTVDDPERTNKAYWGAYGVSKAATLAMASMLSEEQSEGGVAVHVVQPPPIRGALRTRAFTADVASAAANPDVALDAYCYLLGERPPSGQWLVPPAA